MPTIFCDEAGNSGENLVDPEQPFFVLASNDFSPEEATTLLEYVRSKQGGEPKFKTLKKTPDGVRRLAQLFADHRMNEHRIVIDVYHKRYMVVTKLVDLVVETVLYEKGIDLYAQGANIAMANMLYTCMPVLCGAEVTNTFLQCFVMLIRKREDAQKTAYFEAANRLVEACFEYEDLQETLRGFADEELFPVWFDSIGDMALDPAIPALFQHINAWGNRKEDRFMVVHDRSKPVLASKDIFERMMAEVNQESSLIGYDRRKFNFPLRANSLEEGDSVENPQLQIADLCAGAIAHMLKAQESGVEDALSTLLWDLPCQKWIIGALYPSSEVTPEALGTDSADGSNPVDPITTKLRKNRS